VDAGRDAGDGKRRAQKVGGGGGGGGAGMKEHLVPKLQQNTGAGKQQQLKSCFAFHCLTHILSQVKGEAPKNVWSVNVK